MNLGAEIQILIALILSAGLLFAAYRAFLRLFRHRVNTRRSLQMVFLEVSIPKKDSKDDMDKERDQTSEIRKVISIAEHFFSTLHGIQESSWQNKLCGQSHLSFEYIATGGQIQFLIGCPHASSQLLQRQITSFYPEAVIEEVSAPHFFAPDTHQAVQDFQGSKDFFWPLKTYKEFESTDAINNILNSLSSSSDENGNSAGVQFLIRPYTATWHESARKKSEAMQKGEGQSFAWYNPFTWSSANKKAQTENPEPSSQSQSSQTIEAIKNKSDQNAFEMRIRCATSSPDKATAKLHLTNITSAFHQFGGPSFNSLVPLKTKKNSLLQSFMLRSFLPHSPKQNLILSVAEIATLFHLPHIKYNNIPAVKWQKYKIVQAPPNIPKEGIMLGHNVYRGKKMPIYIKNEDRFRHFYVIGQTGTGKSTILLNMIQQDMQLGNGISVIDPHGSLIEDILPFVPKHRIDDVIIFDPSDTQRPMGLNMLEAHTDEEREIVAMDAMNIMLKIFNEETFGPRIQDYFRNGCLTLMADPQGGCITDIVRLFTDEAFQKSKIKHVANPVVKSFWTKQMANTGQKEKQEMIPYFAAKFGAFVTNATMRNIIGQTKSAFDIADCMNNQKILLLNLSKGTLGDINSQLLGLILVSKIQMAAMRRQSIAKEERKDFFLYIDEFQNYVTESIESILSEARKYRLGLHLAHQYLSQIEGNNKKGGINLKDAVFGNVGTKMCYKIGVPDNETMAKVMAPSFSDYDLLNIDKFKAVIQLSVDNQPSVPFSINPPNAFDKPSDKKVAQALKQISRLTYGRSKKFVEQEIFTRLDV